VNREEDDNYVDIIDLSQEYDDVTYGGYELYGTLETKVVGIRYYDGVATQGECVILRREPRNPVRLIPNKRIS